MEILFTFVDVCVAGCGLSGTGLRRRSSGWIASAALAGCWGLACGPAQGQQVVHAVTGTVTDSSTAAHSFTLRAANGNVMMFQRATGHGAIQDKGLAALAGTAPGPDKVGSQVLVFFYGNGSVLTAAGVETLGDAPITRTVGFVDGFDKHKHAIMLKDAATVTMSDKTVVDTPGGVVEGLRYKPNKGERVAVSSSGAAEGATVWLVLATGPNASL